MAGKKGTGPNALKREPQHTAATITTGNRHPNI